MKDAEIDKMVNRFLCWRLPEDFAPDCCVKFTPEDHPNLWPTGTNLLTASQARKMVLHMLSEAETTKC